MNHWTRKLRILVPVALLVSVISSSPATAGDDLEILHKMRAERRAASRARHEGGEKDASQGLFGLLVIPVDFSDARLPEGWESTSLSPRLTPTTGETLHNYFTVASGGRVDVRITLAPLVRLEGTRRDYSDRDLGGIGIRSRAMATETIEAIRDLGFEFRRLDMDGPDLVPGNADDDGEMDGVLILHAAPGRENDPEEGLIEPLQFYLDEPVISQGIAATFYAVASMHSGPGIWAHETAHLLGLEDRYDPLLPSDGGHATSRGGLGRFSLMSSGAWGTGDGRGAALPDAYSRLLMGWIPVSNLSDSSPDPYVLGPGAAARVWTESRIENEFFLLETRDPAAVAPFDAAVPAGEMIIYHIDESLPEGSVSDGGSWEYHLRARVVEADHDFKLQDGLDDGREEDLFPGPLGTTRFAPDSVPASDGYQGPTTVSLTGIMREEDGVSFTVATGDGERAIGSQVDFDFDWPGDWVVDHPDGETRTTWYRWDTAPFLTADLGPILACVDAAYTSSASWPSVAYWNGAHTTLTSGALSDPSVLAIRIVHAVEAEILAADEAADGARIVWVDSAGNEVPAEPLDGYPGRVGTKIGSALHGQPVFFGEDLELQGDIPLWKTDVVVVPNQADGPWRLRFVFASNAQWRFKGWFIASLVELSTIPESAFPVAWNGDLQWDWPFGSGDQYFEVHFRAEDRTEWNSLWSGTIAPDPGSGTYELDGGIVLAGLPGSSRVRHLVRVVGTAAAGPVASRPVTIYEDGGDGEIILLSQPWPNPGRAPIRFQIDVPVALTGKVSIFDLRGRLIRRLDYPAGSHLGVWDGDDSGGHRAPSGAYFLRLEGSGPVTTRKVVLLH